MNYEKELKETYLDWFNNYLTVEGYAKAYNIDVKMAKNLILKGRELYYRDNK